MLLEAVLQNIALSFLGIVSGILIAGGLFGFVVKIGVVTRLVTATKTAKHIFLYEDVLVIGVVIANLISLYMPTIPYMDIVLPICGLFSGIYVGCLAVALAEVVNVMPVFARRIRLKYGMSFLIVSLALGKMCGAWYQLLC